MGFNLEVTQTDQAIGGLIMGFQPQVVLVAEKSRKINSAKLIRDIKTKRASTQFILIKHSTSNDNGELENQVQYVVKSPVHPEELFTALSDVSHLQKQDLINKYAKLSSSIKSAKEGPDESQYIQVSVAKDSSKSKNKSTPKTTIDESDRQKKYDEFLQSLENVNSNETTFERKKIKEFNKELRSQSEFHESPELKIDKFQYTKNLLKKNILSS